MVVCAACQTPVAALLMELCPVCQKKPLAAILPAIAAHQSWDAATLAQTLEAVHGLQRLLAAIRQALAPGTPLGDVYAVYRRTRGVREQPDSHPPADSDGQLLTRLTARVRIYLTEVARQLLASQAAHAQMTPEAYLHTCIIPAALLLVADRMDSPHKVQIGRQRLTAADGQWLPVVPAHLTPLWQVVAWFHAQVAKEAAALLREEASPRTPPRQHHGGREEPRPVPVDPALLVEIDEVLRVLWQNASPQQRLVLELRLEGLATTDIATRLHCDPASVRTQTARLWEKFTAL